MLAILPLLSSFAGVHLTNIVLDASRVGMGQYLQLRQNCANAGPDDLSHSDTRADKQQPRKWVSGRLSLMVLLALIGTIVRRCLRVIPGTHRTRHRLHNRVPDAHGASERQWRMHKQTLSLLLLDICLNSHSQTHSSACTPRPTNLDSREQETRSPTPTCRAWPSRPMCLVPWTCRWSLGTMHWWTFACCTRLVTTAPTSAAV